MRTGEERAKRLKTFFLAALLVFSALIAFKDLNLAYLWRTPGIDFGKHYEAAERVIRNESPYTGQNLYLSFNYPQFVAWLNLPLVLFRDEASAEKAWDLFNILLVIMTILIVVFGYKSPSCPSFDPSKEPVFSLEKHWWILGIFLSFFFSPNTDGLLQGNLSPWVLFSMALLGWMVIRNRDAGIGIFIALCSLMKIMPVLLIIPYIIARKKKVLMAAGAVWGIYLLVLAATGALKHEWFFITRVLPHIGTYWHYVSYSIPYVLMRHISKGVYENPVSMRWVTIFWNVLMTGSYIVLCIRGRDMLRTRSGHQVFFALGTLLLPLLPPLFEYHHLVWSFPGILIIFILLIRGWMRRNEILVILPVILCLSIAGPMADVFDLGNFSLVAVGPVCGLILYITLGLIIHRRLSRIWKD